MEDRLHSLLLVRHAEAEHHVSELTGGWTDTALTPTGHQQATLLAQRLQQELAGVPLRLVSGDLQRTVQTSQIIGEALHLPVEISTHIRDLNNGLAAGKTHAEAQEIALEPTEPIVDWQPYPQAESWRQFFQRISAFIGPFTAAQQTPAILVSHIAVIHVIIAWWLGLPVESPVHFDLAPASLTVLRVNRWQERTIERLNDTAHLYAAGIPNPIHL